MTGLSEYSRTAALEMVAGDPGLLTELLGVFLADVPARLRLMENAAAAQDLATLMHEAHAIKGACGTIAAMGNLQHMQALEHAARNNNGEAVAELWVESLEQMHLLLQDLHLDYEALRHTHHP
ncbi:HPt (histidine-containing phosphotransfer) domain-containing protein [Silvimonas terrae]|uniref:HPt (Histidine-containing phosphotransfer) domain-containing protein n=1 Tax=Silvimonas terrae TaxID=300266 RepID=A0A840RKC6_9NEIS|nr:Hpt domain-containing protein [Silvimonas terrae]MBB5193597.1 HPt (histidine-containing phosphotransfer) domain-containing protein [Silvimonas terrae]